MSGLPRLYCCASKTNLQSSVWSTNSSQENIKPPTLLFSTLPFPSMRYNNKISANFKPHISNLSIGMPPSNIEDEAFQEQIWHTVRRPNGSEMSVYGPRDLFDVLTPQAREVNSGTSQASPLSAPRSADHLNHLAEAAASALSTVYRGIDKVGSYGPQKGKKYNNSWLVERIYEACMLITSMKIYQSSLNCLTQDTPPTSGLQGSHRKIGDPTMVPIVEAFLLECSNRLMYLGVPLRCNNCRLTGQHSSRAGAEAENCVMRTGPQRQVHLPVPSWRKLSIRH